MNKTKNVAAVKDVSFGQIFMMLSESSGNQKSMWTKLPAALKWITAVHHCTLDDTFHQLNTKRDKELDRNNLLFLQYSVVHHETRGT